MQGAECADGMSQHSDVIPVKGACSDPQPHLPPTFFTNMEIWYQKLRHILKTYLRHIKKVYVTWHVQNHCSLGEID